MEKVRNLVDEYVVADATGIRKSKFAKTNFSHHVLENKTRVVFTESAQKKCKKQELMAVACVSVNAGSMHEPRELSGLAHYLEHMLFMGSAKYPDEHDFDEYVAKHGGFTNAYTCDNRTVYYFGIFVDHFREAFDKFINFFVEPLLLQDCLERECEAVDSEYSLACSNYNIKDYYILYKSLKKDCLVNHFSYGNKATLIDYCSQNGIDVRERLLAYFEKYYRPELMQVCVSLPISLSEDSTLHDFVLDTVSVIPAARNVNLPFAENLLLYPNFYIEQAKDGCAVENTNFMNAEKYDCFYHVATEKVLNKLVLHWNLPVFDSTTTLPYYNYITWLLGHEGDGSLTQYLKEQGYIVKLHSSIEKYHYHFTDVAVSMKLTNKGLGNIGTVVQCVFDYVELVRSADKQTLFGIFCEMLCIDLVELVFKPNDDCSKLANNIIEAITDDNLPIEYCVTGHLNRDNDAEHFDLMNLLINKFDRKCCLILLMAPESSVDLVDEPIKTALATQDFVDSEFFDVRFKFFRNDLIFDFDTKSSKNKFSLPKKNLYLYQNFSYENVEKEKKEKFPQSIYLDEKLEIYFKKDLKFKQPLTAVGMQFYHGQFPVNCIKTKQNAMVEFFVCSGLYVAIFDYLIAEQLYDASLLGYTVQFQITPECCFVEMFGFTDYMPRYVEHVLTMFKQIEISEAVFKLVKQNFLDSLCNFLMSRSNLKSALLYMIYKRYSVNTFDMVNHLKNGQVTLQQLLRFRDGLFQHGFASFLVQGSMNRENAVQLLTDISQKVLVYRPNRSNVFSLLTNKIPSNCTIRVRHANLHNKDKNSHASLLYNFNDNSISYEERHAILTLLNTMMSNCFFDQLRTKLQLAYTLHTDVASIAVGTTVMSLQMCYKAKKFSPEHIQQKIEWFVSDFFYEKLKNMPEREFRDYKEACRNKCLKKPTSLKSEFRKNFLEFKNSQLNFAKKIKQAEFISSICLERLKRLYEKIYIADRACIKVHVIADSGDAFKFQPLEFVFKRGTEESVDCSDYERLYNLLIAG